MRLAARNARSVSLPYATGAPNTAITASPMCLSMVPPICAMTPSTNSKKRSAGDALPPRRACWTGACSRRDQRTGSPLAAARPAVRARFPKLGKSAPRRPAASRIADKSARPPGTAARQLGQNGVSTGIANALHERNRRHIVPRRDCPNGPFGVTWQPTLGVLAAAACTLTAW